MSVGLLFTDADARLVGRTHAVCQKGAGSAEAGVKLFDRRGGPANAPGTSRPRAFESPLSTSRSR